MHLFHVPGLMCGGCLGFVTRALHGMDPAARIEADLPARTFVTRALHGMDPAARIEADLPARTIRVISARFESVLLRALGEAGYAADPVLQAWG
jgi:copper chaperone